MGGLIFSLPILLYAEVHYRIGRLFSRYFMREPEIVADAPFRLRAGKELPIALMIKDAHKYPVELEAVTVQVRRQAEKRGLPVLQKSQLKIEQPFWHTIFFCWLPEEWRGTIQVDVIIEYTCGGKQHTCVNDNYRLTSHLPFVVEIDDSPWPRGKNWHFGETHCHSHLSSDQVEFGAPPEVFLHMARALELDFVAITDHSYDLDDRIDDYLTNDPALPKWKELWRSVEALNEENHDIVMIPGEELSAGNSKGENVHLLIYNSRRFFTGTGDSAERWFHTRPQHRIAQVLLLENNTLAVAAHPQTTTPFFQKWLLHRGIWTDDDYRLHGLAGAQFWNGDKDMFLREGLPQWISLLLDGLMLPLIAGNDAHGSFNRFRQIGTPHLTFREEQREIFGSARTGVLIDGEYNASAILDALRNGHAICSDGPFGDLELHQSEQIVRIGGQTPINEGDLRVRLISSSSFGAIYRAELITGNVNQKKETRKHLETPSGLYNFNENYKLSGLPMPGYIRLEVETRLGEKRSHCFTNPIYLRPIAA
jgi:hypothetical protein